MRGITVSSNAEPIKGGNMNKAVSKCMGLMLVLSLTIMGSAFADENEVVALKGEVKDLNNKLATLESQMNTMQGHISANRPIPTRVVAEGEQEGGLIHTLQDIHMGGYLDIQYTQNLNSESSNVGGTGGPNGLRTFDQDMDTFSLNAAVLEFQKAPAETGGAGFRLDIAMGENAQVVDSTGPSAINAASTFGGGNLSGTDSDEFSLQQMYVDVNAPLKFLEGNGIFDDVINIKVGRFVTLAGAEVIRSGDNWNISRSLLFGLAIPFTHTGIRSTYKLFNDRVTTYLGMNNGWDNVIDSNTGKTLEAGTSIALLDDLTLTSILLYGPENERQEGHRRFVLSNVATWHATDKLSFMGEATFGTERRVAGLQGLAFKNAQWHGYALYARYQFTDKFAMAARGEIFRDDDGFREGITTAPFDDTVLEYTLTAEYQLYENLISRLEFRHDSSDDREAFNGDESQHTLGAQLIYNFA